MVLTPKGTVQRDFRPPVFFHHSNQPWYDTPGRLTHRGMIPRGVMFWQIFYWLAGVWYSREIDSPGYQTPGRLKNSINSANSSPNSKYFNPLVISPGRFELWKKLTSKISLDSPFKYDTIFLLTRYSFSQKMCTLTHFYSFPTRLTLLKFSLRNP